MKGTATHDRGATSGEEAAFNARLLALLNSTKERLAKLNSNDYVLRVMTIRSHDVKAHTRKTFEKVYLAKKVTRRKRARVNPVAKAIVGKLPTPSVSATVRQGKMTGRVYVKGAGKRVPRDARP
jgi:hypothetical protein